MNAANLLSSWGVEDAGERVGIEVIGNALHIPVMDPITGERFHRVQVRTPGKDLFWGGEAAYEGEPTPDFSAAPGFVAAASASGSGVIHIAKGIKEELALITASYENTLRLTREVLSASTVAGELADSIRIQPKQVLA